MRTVDPHWVRRWSSPGIGRFWKRCLSKARRQYARAICDDRRGRQAKRYESECNYKTW